MNDEEREFTFLVRIRQQTETDVKHWRGSVHEVTSGKRRYITAAHEVADFIASYLRSEHRDEF